MKRPMRPFEIELEPVRECNMSCDFCGNYSLPKQPDFMSPETIEATAKRLRYGGGFRVGLLPPPKRAAEQVRDM